TATAAPAVKVSPDVDSGVYEPGQKVTWNIVATDEEQPLSGKVAFSVRRGGLTEIASGEVELTEGKGQISATRDNPGALLLTVNYKPAGSDKDITADGGAIYEPGKIAATAPPPDD